GRHVAAAVPAFIAQAEQSNFVRRRMPVRCALLLERRRLRGGHVLQPIGRFLGRARAQVDRNVSLATDLVDEVHEFVRPKSARLDHAAPVWVKPHDSLRPDPVAPVRSVGEAASGPAYVWHMNRFQCGNHVVADAACVRNCGIGTDPDTVVNAMSEMLGELPEQIAVDLRTGFGCVNRQLDFLCSHYGRGKSHNDQSNNDTKCTHKKRYPLRRSASDKRRTNEEDWVKNPLLAGRVST